MSVRTKTDSLRVFTAPLIIFLLPLATGLWIMKYPTKASVSGGIEHALKEITTTIFHANLVQHCYRASQSGHICFFNVGFVAMGTDLLLPIKHCLCVDPKLYQWVVESLERIPQCTRMSRWDVLSPVRLTHFGSMDTNHAQWSRNIRACIAPVYLSNIWAMCSCCP